MTTITDEIPWLAAAERTVDELIRLLAAGVSTAGRS